MAYMVIEDFSMGLDLRKGPVTASAKSLRVLRNGFINAGGEIEKRMAFERQSPHGSAMAGTYGLKGVGVSLWTFGTLPRPSTLPAFIGYHQIAGGPPVMRLTDVEVFDSKFYTVWQFNDGTFHHFYDGAPVATAPNAPTIMAYRSKMYAVWGNILYFSALNDPSFWTPNDTTKPGAGFIQIDSQQSGGVQLMGLSVYYNQLAVFSTTECQLWAMDEDPASNQLVQTISNCGLVAPHARSPYSTGDVLFLHTSGVRSLKARDSSNAASVSDIGSPVDDPVRQFIAQARVADPGHPVPEQLAISMGVIEPLTGQFWLNLGTDIYVLSLSPASNITAWSTYSDGFTPDWMAIADDRIWLRAGADLYAFTGWSRQLYDASTIEAITPLIAGNEPATAKEFTSFDAALEGTWVFEVGTNLLDPTVRDLVGTVTGPSFGQGSIGLSNDGTHISVRATCTDAARARIGNMMFHYNKGHED